MTHRGTSGLMIYLCISPDNVARHVCVLVRTETKPNQTKRVEGTKKFTIFKIWDM